MRERAGLQTLREKADTRSQPDLDIAEHLQSVFSRYLVEILSLHG